MSQIPVSFSIRLPNSGPYTTASSVASVAILADELGFEALTVHDHISRSRRQNRHFSAGSVEQVKDTQDPILYEAMITLAFAASLTKKIRLFPTGITLGTRDPRLLAKQVATLHELSGKRFMLGVTVGAAADEFEIMQVPFTERGRRADEYLAVVHQIFGPDPLTTVNGATVHFTNGEFYPKPDNLPIWICGKGKAAMRRVARYGSGFLPAGFSLDNYREKMPLLDEQMALASRRRSDIVCGLETFVLVRSDKERAVDDSNATLMYWYKEMEKGLNCNLIGTPESIAEQIHSYIEIGVRHFELKFIAKSVEDQLDMMRAVAAYVVPKFT